MLDQQCLENLGLQVISARAPAFTQNLPSWQYRSAPVLLSGLKDIITQKGEAVTFRCSVQGEPKPSVIWYKDSEQLHSGIRYWMHYDGKYAELRINNVGPEDDGWYRCVAKNAFGSTQTSGGLRHSSGQTRRPSHDPNYLVNKFNLANLQRPSLTLAKRRRRICRKLYYGGLLSYR